MVRCIAIDDEPLALRQIKSYIERNDQLELVASCRSAIQAREILAKESIDLIFVDINMPDLNGIDFVRQLTTNQYIIFTTAHSEYALEGFKLNAIDYLLKPFTRDEFEKATQKVISLVDLVERCHAAESAVAQNEAESADNEVISVKADYKTQLVKVADIEFFAVAWEKLNLFFCCLVGAQETVHFVVAGTVDGFCHKVIKAVYFFCTCSFEQAFAACAGMDICTDYTFCVRQNICCAVCKDNLCFTAFVCDKFFIVFNIVHLCERMWIFAEKSAVFCFVHNCGPRVNAFFVQLVESYKMVANLVRWVAEHKNDFLCAACNALEYDGEAVTGQNWEDETDCVITELVLNICCDIVTCDVVALCACNNSFCYTNDVAVVNFDIFFFKSFKQALNCDVHKIVTFNDNRCSDTSGYCADCS